MMSEGRNEKVEPGNSWGSRVRSSRTYWGVGRCFSARVT